LLDGHAGAAGEFVYEPGVLLVWPPVATGPADADGSDGAVNAAQWRGNDPGQSESLDDLGFDALAGVSAYRFFSQVGQQDRLSDAHGGASEPFADAGGLPGEEIGQLCATSAVTLPHG
jgi:hypothetical protein